MTKKQLRGGNSSIVRNGVLYGNSPSNCLRMVLLRDKGVQSTPDERSRKVFKIGHTNEDFFQDDYLKDIPEVIKEMEVQVGLSDNVDFVGHCDLSIPGLLYELKSCTSDNTYKKVFIEGKYKKENLIQLATYLLMTETPEGYLAYTSYTDTIQYKKLDKIKEDDIFPLMEQSERETVLIHVTFTDSGQILANGDDTGVHVGDILAFQETAVAVLENDTIYTDRPEPFDSKDKFTACGMCPLSNVCLEWEAKRFSTERFVKEARKALNLPSED